MKNRAKLDWEGARRRLEESRAALEETLAPDPRRIEAAYRERARRLARPPDPGRDEPTLRVMVFRARGGLYGIELARVSEVVSNPRYARVPGAPAQLAGVIQVRGEIRPVWDFARLLGLDGGAESPAGAVLLVPRASGMAGGAENQAGAVLLVPRASGLAGLRVDEVVDIRELRQAGLRQPAGARRHIKLVTPDFITVIDPDELWTNEEIG